MNVLSVDPSSSRSGVVLFIDNEPKTIRFWDSAKKDDLGKRLFEWGAFLYSVRAKTKLDYVSVLKSSMRRNINTVRMIAYFESVVIHCAGAWETPVYLINDKSARKKALGNGGLTKEESFSIVKEQYPVTNLDESDALVAGLSCIAEHG